MLRDEAVRCVLDPSALGRRLLCCCAHGLGEVVDVPELEGALEQKLCCGVSCSVGRGIPARAWKPLTPHTVAAVKVQAKKVFMVYYVLL